MGRATAGGGWAAIWYSLRKAREVGGFLRLYRALRSRNACKTCALGMGGQRGGMVNEAGRFPEVCKKSIQAMAADMQGRIRPGFFEEFSVDRLRALSPRELEHAGRLTTPLLLSPEDPSHYRPVAWDVALDRVSAKLRATDPARSFFYFSGRSSNEAAFLLQLLARLYGTNNVSNCSYYCHQASGVALASVLGSGTATVTLDDLDACDTIFLIGANPASNHPRFMRTLMEVRRRGGAVIVVNPLRELGLVRFKVPSDPRSLLFGTDIASEYVQPHIGGDIAFLLAVAKRVNELGATDEPFLRDNCDGGDALLQQLRALDARRLTELSGVDPAAVERVARVYAASKGAIFCWAMGMTHHEHGVENVQAIANLALLRGMAGRPGAGLLPLRGHSNVQGVGSMGVTPQLKTIVCERLEEEFGVKMPAAPGMDTLASLEAAERGDVRFALCLGGNLYGASPDASFAARAMNAIDTVVYLSTTLNTGHAHGVGRETIILPVRARDEEAQATTQESMFNYVRLSDGGPARLEGPRSEVEVIAGIGERVLDPQRPVDWTSMRRHASIREAISRIVPGYEAVGAIDSTKREFQIGGRTFHEPSFATASGRAKIHIVEPPPLKGGADGSLRIMTMRSEGQFNTVVYEEEDRYRALERRDVILMNEGDVRRLGLREDERVRVRGPAGALEVLVRRFDVPPGNAAMYYPEANAIMPTAADPKSRTPAFKSFTARVEKLRRLPVLEGASS